MTSAQTKPSLWLFLGAVAFTAICAGLVFGGVFKPHYQREYSPDDFGPAQFDYRPVAFADLPGWPGGDLAPTLSAFLKSCDSLLKRADDAAANSLENLSAAYRKTGLSGKIGDWRAPCERAKELAAPDQDSGFLQSPRMFFELYFQPMQVLGRREPLPDGPARRAGALMEDEALYTGYFEPSFSASRMPDDVHDTPIYPRPDDLVDVNLGAFREDLAGERISGKLEGNRLVPYADRTAINGGALDSQTNPIAWMNADDLFFLQIQGSGRLAFTNDDVLRVGYDGQNGQPYTPIGRILVERSLMPLEDVSMQSIRQWLDDADKDAAQELREQNQSYVFFRALDELADAAGPLGAQGVPLTPERSLAVDRKYHVLGAPVWVDIEPVDGAGDTRIQMLMIAQDTGGAIRGPLRGDVFWGASEHASEIAGKMNARGAFYVFTPRAVAARLANENAP